MYRPIWLLLLCLATVLGGCAGQPDGPWLVLDAAERVAAVGADADGGAAEPIRLPDVWDATGLASRGARWRYDLQLRLDAAPTEVQALYIPRVGNRFAVAVNGQLLAQAGRFGDTQVDAGAVPHLVPVPIGLLHAGANDIHVTVEGEPARRAGLAPIWVGPLTELQPLYQQRHALRTDVPLVMASVALAFAAVMAVLAWVMRDRGLVLLTLAGVCFAVYILHDVLGTAPLPLPLWDALAEGAHAGLLLALVALAHHMLRHARSGFRWGRAEHALLLAAAVLVPLYAWGRQVWAHEAWSVCVLVYGAWLMVRVWRCAWHSRNRVALGLAVGVTLTVVFTLASYLGSRLLADGYMYASSSPFALLAVLCVLVWLLAERYRRLVVQREALHAASAVELQTQRQQLESRFEVRHREARQQERQRILRDIHDGMGLQLTGLLALAQDEGAGRERLTREVRIAIEQMRLLVDNAEAFEGDVGMLLGQIRYQIARRLAHTETQLHWQTALSHPERTLRPAQAVALQRIVFELTTNVIKHAEARHLEVLARDNAAGALLLMFSDDGVGLAQSPSRPGIGLRSIQERAEEMGGTFERVPTAVGTRYRLSLPPEAFER